MVERIHIVGAEAGPPGDHAEVYERDEPSVDVGAVALVHVLLFCVIIEEAGADAQHFSLDLCQDFIDPWQEGFRHLYHSELFLLSEGCFIFLEAGGGHHVESFFVELVNFGVESVFLWVVVVHGCAPRP